MTLSSARAYYGLVASAEHTSTNVAGTASIGTSQTAVNLTGADVAYSVRCILAAADDAFVINLATGDTSASDSWTAGTAQVETSTALGTITLAGNASITVTAAGMTGSPKTISVAVALNDTAAQWAEKVRTALAADADVSALFTVSGTTTAIVLTRKPSTTFTVGAETVNIYPANDGTLNISLDNGTCTGITTAATSADTTAGVATAGAKIYDGDGTDFEGVTLPTIANMLGLVVSMGTGQIAITSVLGDITQDSMVDGQVLSRICSDASQTFDVDTLTVTAGSPSNFTITAIGKTT